MKRLALVLGLVMFATPSVSGGSSIQEVKQFCQNRWNDDFVMQQHCQKEQEKAFFDVFSTKIAAEKSPTIQKIIVFCRKRWSEKTGLVDYVMLDNCIEEQAKAYYELNLAK